MKPALFWKRVIKRLCYSGIRLTGELPAHLPEFRHAPVLPYRATLSPWITDRTFIDAFNQIRNSTLVDVLRCYGIWSLVGQSAKLAPGCFIEVGAWRGGTGCLIGLATQHFAISDPVLLCDTFSGVPKAGQFDTRYKGGEHSDTSITAVEKLATSLRLDNLHVLVGIFPEDTGELIPDDVRLVHIDVDVYQSAKDAVEFLWPRVVSGGIVVFDDFATHGCEGITRFVNEFSLRDDCLMIHNLNGHAVLIKKECSAMTESTITLTRTGDPIFAFQATCSKCGDTLKRLHNEREAYYSTELRNHVCKGQRIENEA